MWLWGRSASCLPDGGSEVFASLGLFFINSLPLNYFQKPCSQSLPLLSQPSPASWTGSWCPAAWGTGLWRDLGPAGAEHPRPPSSLCTSPPFPHLPLGKERAYCRLLLFAGGNPPPAPVHLSVPGPHSRSIPLKVSETPGLVTLPCPFTSKQLSTQAFSEEAFIRHLLFARHCARPGNTKGVIALS